MTADSLPQDAHVAILAGGEGTRLWPLSRSRRPKQLLQLSGSRSLIQQTVDRLLPLVAPERILIITERSHADDLRAQLPELPDTSIVVEPTRRGTAAALLLAALHIRERAPEATWASVHSDAFITDDDEFRRTLSAALIAAQSGDHLLTTGVRPRFPATGYGYIQVGDALGAVAGYEVRRVRRFVEKPDLATAQEYVASGDYLWNPGVFVWRNSALLGAFAEHLPDIFSTLDVPVARVDEVYANARRETIDVGIMEQATNVATIPSDFGWSDIGSWAELWELAADRDDADNVARGAGRVLSAESARNLVYAEGRSVAIVGVSDLVVVETADAVFICPRDRAQDVKLIVQRLQQEGSTDLL